MHYTICMIRRTALIYGELIRLGPMANQELANHLDLSPASITQILRPLLAAGILRELDPTNYREERLYSSGTGIKKRRKITLTPDRSKGYALTGYFKDLTLSFRKTSFDLSLDRGFEQKITLDPSGHIPDQIGSAIRDIGAKDPRSLLGIGFTVSGRVDYQTGRILYSTNLPYLLDLDLAGELGKSMGVPVVILNDSHALSVGERFTGAAREMEHFFTLFIDEGVGLGIFIGGRPYQGFEHLAGEAGQLILVPQGREHRGVVDGAFEAYVGQDAIWDQLTRLDLPPAYAQRISRGPGQAYPLLLDLVRENDARALGILDDLGEKLGLLCTNLGLLFSPQVSFITGPPAAFGALLLERVRAAVRNYGPVGMRESLAERISLRSDYLQRMALGTAKAAFEAYLNDLDQRS